jgi:hypothetical protein
LADLFLGFFLTNPLPLADYKPEWSKLGRFYNLVNIVVQEHLYINFKSLDVSIETGPSRIMPLSGGLQMGMGDIICMLLFIPGPATC